MQKTVFFFLIWFTCIGCISEADILVPRLSSEVVLNGIIHPESVIQVRLTRSLPLDEGQILPIIDNAEVIVYENDRLVGQLSFKDSIYSIDYYPQEGHQYTVEAKVSDKNEEKKVIRASDVMPSSPTVYACFTKEDYLYSDINVSATIQNNFAENNFYWLDVVTANYPFFDCEFVKEDTSTRYCLGRDSTRLIVEQESPLGSYSTIPDRFNAFVDNLSGGIADYNTYIRISDEGLEDQLIELDFTGYSQLFRHNVLSDPSEGQSLLLTVTSASQHYDRYLKSSIIYYLNNGFDDSEDTPNPFAEPTRIYSNVENGLGIFAAYNSTQIHVEDFPCP